jgi:hypothetical protein
MANYVFTGDYQTNVSLPDGSVVTVDPGETVKLDFPEPGPLWAGPGTKIGKAAAKAAKVAKEEAAKTAEEKATKAAEEEAAKAAEEEAAKLDPGVS